VDIPDTLLRGQNAVFNCTFTLEDEKLYAIKWYRGTYEIFRYIPSDNPPLKTFPLLGYNVSMKYSTGNTMVLNKVDFINSGAYSCEVIADTNFHTLIQTKHMLVIDLPDEKPRITGVKEQYDVGDGITASCTSWQSHPAANLSWFINGEPAREGYLRRYKLRKEYDDTFTTVLGLHFEVSRNHFIKGKMTLKCTSSMLAVYWQSREVEIKESTISSYSMPVDSRGGGGTFHRDKERQTGGKKKGASSIIKSLRGGDGGQSGETVTSSKKNNGAKVTAKNSGNSAGSKKMPVEELTSHVLSSSSSGNAYSTSRCWGGVSMAVIHSVLMFHHLHQRALFTS